MPTQKRDPFRKLNVNVCVELAHPGSSPMNVGVSVATRPEMKTTVEEMKMRYAATLDDALARAHALGKKTTTVIPNGISVIIR